MVCLDVVQVCVLETVGCCVFRRGSGVCVGNGVLWCVVGGLSAVFRVG